MPYDPMEGFQIGQAVGKARRSSLGRTTDYMSELFQKRSEDKSSLDKELAKSLAVEKIKSSFQSPKEDAMTRYYNSLNEGMDSQPQQFYAESMASQMGVSPEDLFMKPTVTRFRGQTKVVPTPELKPALDSKSTNELGAFRSTRQNLQNNLNLMTPGVKGFMNPFDPRSGRGGIGQFALKSQSFFGDEQANEFLTFKAETDKVFQEFRKATTGAQAALKELGWLEPDYPMSNDPPDLYTQKANEAIKRMEEGENMLLDLYSQRGFRVGDLRKGMNPIQQSAASQSSVSNQDSTNQVDTLLNKWKSKYGSSK